MTHSFWGWIPILTRTIYFESASKNQIVTFEKANTDLLKEMILSNKYKQINNYFIQKKFLSDRITEQVIFNEIKLRDVTKTNEIATINVTIGGSKYILIPKYVSNMDVVNGTATIRPTGMVLYEFQACTDYAADYANIMHIIIRDIFHKHDHHLSDLPLVTVEANSEEDAIYKIATQYIQKLIEYKQKLLQVPTKLAIKDLHRAKGEIQYAKAFLDINKRKIDENELAYLTSTIDSFDRSFEVILGRLHDRINLSFNCAIWALTLILISLAFVSQMENSLLQYKFYQINECYSLSLFHLFFLITAIVAMACLCKSVTCYYLPEEGALHFLQKHLRIIQ
jgi:hypothetical protein